MAAAPLAEARARIVALQRDAQEGDEQQRLAGERLRASNQAKSQALLTFLRQHAEEDEKKVELERCQKRIKTTIYKQFASAGKGNA